MEIINKIIFLDQSIGLGDQLCLQPIILYIKKYTNPNAVVYVETDYPEIYQGTDIITEQKEEEFSKDMSGFEKISFFIYKKDNILKIPKQEFKGHSVDLANLFVDSYLMLNHKYLPYICLFNHPMLMPCTDFYSCAYLGRILPEEEKRITISLKKEAIEKIKQLVFPIDLEKAIIIHRKSLEQIRELPAEYSIDLLKSLSKIAPTILFGQGEEEVNIPENIINLTNKLSIDELFTLISQAKILVTNDSSPLHIASAFDNHIILLTTLKHQDNLFHVRNGSRHYKAKAFYKKLIIEGKDIPLEEVPALHTPTPNPAKYNLVEYLPNIQEVVEYVKSLF